jgi:hypothetical protein
MPPVVAVISAVVATVVSTAEYLAFMYPWIVPLAKVGLGIGTSLVLSGVARSLQKHPSLGSSPGAGNLLHDAQSRTVTAREAVAPRRLIYGNPRVGGVITYIGKTGADGEFLELGGLECL